MKKLLFAIALTALMVSAVAGAALAANTFPAFKSYTLSGEEVSQSLFADKKLTMINFWGTFCPPCIDEMPDLGKLGDAMPEGTQLVGIVVDISDKETLDEAIAILNDSNASFTNLLVSEEMMSYLQTLVGVPTTIFVDAKGTIVGEPLVGSRSGADYRKEIEKALKLVR